MPLPELFEIPDFRIVPRIICSRRYCNRIAGMVPIGRHRADCLMVIAATIQAYEGKVASQQDEKPASEETDKITAKKIGSGEMAPSNIIVKKVARKAKEISKKQSEAQQQPTLSLEDARKILKEKGVEIK